MQDFLEEIVFAIERNPSEALAAFFGILFSLWVLRRLAYGNRYTSHIVLRSYHIDRDADVMVDIVGRERGLIALLQTLFGLGTEYRMRVTRQVVYIRESNLSGQQWEILPIAHINMAACGFAKPLWLLVLALLLFFTAGMLFLIANGSRAGVADQLPLIIAPALVGLFCFLGYLFGRTMAFRVSAGEGYRGFQFRGTSAADFDKVLLTVQIINDRAIELQTGQKASDHSFLIRR